MKRKLAAGAALLLAIGAACFLWPADPVSFAAYEKIHLEMTLQEVEALLGPGQDGRSHDESMRRLVAIGKEPVFEGRQYVEKGSEDADSVRYWQSNSGLLVVGLSREERVILKMFWEWRRPEPHFFYALRAWIGW